MKNVINGITKVIVAIYIRVSTLDQAREGHSLGEQEKRLTALAEAKGYKIHKVYSDAGISGKSAENRPAYQQMMKDMKKGKFNRIMAFKMDRISRSISDFENFFNEIEEYNCEVEFLEGNIDMTGASGKLFARILEVFAQFERELIVERTLVGVESAANKGNFGGKPPLGYKKEIIDEKSTKKWIIDEEGAKIVREIFDLCLNGKTYFQISNILKEKYPKVISKKKKDEVTGEEKIVYRAWTDSSISTILNGKYYIGIYEYRRNVENKETIEIVDIVPKIIDEDIFYQCQENIQKNIRNYYRGKQYLFMQKLVCPKCGRIMACNGTKKANGTEYLYYKCKDCKTYFREDYLESELVEALAKYLGFYLLLEKDYVVVDKETAKKLNTGKIGNTIRYALDIMLIENRFNKTNCYLLEFLWNSLEYEEKREFISTYIDTIKIKKYHVKGEKNPRIKILELKLKPNKFKKLFQLEQKNMIDEIVSDSSGYDFSVAEFDSRKKADDYINVLKEKYNIRVVDTNKGDYLDIAYNEVFKMISIKSNRAVEKDNILWLELVGDYKEYLEDGSDIILTNNGCYREEKVL